MVEHLLVALVEAGPVEEQIVVRDKIVRPLLVLQKFLPHEQHGNARRGQTEPGRDTGTAARKPGAGIRRIPETGDALLPALVDDVVILRPLHETPLLAESLRPEAPAPGPSCSADARPARSRCR